METPEVKKQINPESFSPEALEAAHTKLIEAYREFEGNIEYCGSEDIGKFILIVERLSQQPQVIGPEWQKRLKHLGEFIGTMGIAGLGYASQADVPRIEMTHTLPQLIQTLPEVIQKFKSTLGWLKVEAKNLSSEINNRIKEITYAKL